MDEDFGDHSLDFGLDQRAPTWCNYGDTVNAEREWAGHQEKQSSGPERQEQRTPALLHGQEPALSLQQRLKHGNEGHFLIHLGIAQGHSGLARKNFQNFDVRGPQKIGVATFHGEHADAARLVIQRPGVKAAHSRIGEVSLEFGARFFAVAVNVLAMLADVNDLLGQSRPLQNFVERGDVRRVGVDLGETRDRAELEAATLLENDRRALIWDDRLRRVDDGLWHALQIERGSDLVVHVV